MDIKRIVRGNDFILRIQMCKVKDGTREPFPLSSSNSIAVSLVNQFRRYLLDREVDSTDDSIVLARVEGDTLPCGTYAVEVKGRQFSDDWRTADCSLIQIVEYNSQADTDLGDLIEGDIVEIGTMTVGASSTSLNPRGEWTEGATYHKGDVVNYAGCCWWANEQTDTEPSKDNAAWTLMMDATPDFAISRNRLTVKYN